MKFCKRTISNTVKNTQNKPGATGQKESDQVSFAQRFDNPSEKIKKDQKGMEYYKEDIKKPKHVLYQLLIIAF